MSTLVDTAMMEFMFDVDRALEEVYAKHEALMTKYDMNLDVRLGLAGEEYARLYEEGWDIH